SSDPKGGDRKFIPLLVRAGLSSGFVDALFLEVHEDPECAKCDASTQWPLNKLEDLLLMAKESFIKGKELIKKYNF
ncbi:MAG: 3-deoxy-8-phosphooctulonate synthase, partial [candidate division WOR-3 bacterium]